MILESLDHSFSTLKILATVKLDWNENRCLYCFSTLKILATVKQEVTIRFDAFGFSTLKILAYKYEMISND